jgi:hypothetical protein
MNSLKTSLSSLSRRFARRDGEPAAAVQIATPPTSTDESSSGVVTSATVVESDVVATVVSASAAPADAAQIQIATPPSAKRQSSQSSGLASSSPSPSAPVSSLSSSVSSAAPRPPCETCGAAAVAIVTDDQGRKRPFCKPCVQVQQALFEKEMRERLNARASNPAAAAAVAPAVELEADNNSWRERAKRAQMALLASITPTKADEHAAADGGAVAATAQSGADDDDSFFSSMLLKARSSMDSLRRSSSAKPLEAPSAAQQTSGAAQASAAAPPPQQRSPIDLLAKLTASTTVLGLPRDLFVARILPLIVTEQRDIERLALVDRAMYETVSKNPPSGWLLRLYDSVQSTERCLIVRRFSRFDGIKFEPVMFLSPFSAQPLQTRCLGGGSFKALCDFAHDSAVAKAAGRPAGDSMLHVASIDLSACSSARDQLWKEASPFEKLHNFVSLRELKLGTLELGTHEKFWTLLSFATSLESIDAGLMAAPMDDVRALQALPRLETLHIRARDWPAAVVSQLPARLRHLVLRGGTVDLRALAAIAETCTRLESLAASAVLTAAASPAQSRLLKNGLKSIELRAASTPEAPVCVARSIVMSPSNVLESLALGDVGDDADPVADALHKCTALRRFSASFSEPSAADGALEAMGVAKLTELRSLTITRATDYGVKCIKKFGANLTALDLSNCTLVTQSGLVAALVNTGGLRQLNLSGVASGGAALVKLAAQLTALRELRMDKCGVGNEALAALGAACTRLELVSLCANSEATSPAVAGALLQWRRLQTLHIADCAAMDDSLLATISCVATLRELTLSDRSAVSSIEILIHALDELEKLNVQQGLSESLEAEPLRLFSVKAQEGLLKHRAAARKRRLLITVKVNGTH